SWLLRSPRRTVTWPLPPMWVSKVQPLEASSRLSSCAFITYNLFHSSVEVNKNVEFGTSRICMQQPCLVCGRKPSDPHHLRYMQPRALGRKASDEFAVRAHHRAAHRAGDGRARWKAAHRFYPYCAHTLEADARGGGPNAARCDHANFT